MADYLCLTDVDLRTKFEPPHGLFIAEGRLVIERAVRAGYPLRSLLVSPRWLDSVADLAVASRADADSAAPAPIYVAAPGVIEAVTGFHVHRGALASVRRPPLPDVGVLLQTARRVAVLEDVNTHTNVGAIFRGAAALGMDALLLTRSCADPLYRRSVRVSMGEVFAVPYARLEAWPDEAERLRASGFRLLALTPAPAAPSLESVRIGADEAVAVVLGPEGPGLSARTLAAADERVRIPMSRGVDSLNVGAAAAVAFYVLGRR